MEFFIDDKLWIIKWRYGLLNCPYIFETTVKNVTLFYKHVNCLKFASNHGGNFFCLNYELLARALSMNKPIICLSKCKRMKGAKTDKRTVKFKNSG